MTENRSTLSIQDAVARLIEELRTDPGYYQAWQANIAMAFQDEMQTPRGMTRGEHAVANAAAKRFLDLLMRRT